MLGFLKITFASQKVLQVYEKLPDSLLVGLVSDYIHDQSSCSNNAKQRCIVQGFSTSHEYTCILPKTTNEGMRSFFESLKLLCSK